MLQSSFLKTMFVFCGRSALLFCLTYNISLAANPMKGGELYAAHCSSCHGASGVGTMPEAPNFTQNESLMLPDPYLLSSIKQGKGIMPAYQGLISDQDILDVIAYLRTFNN